MKKIYIYFWLTHFHVQNVWIPTKIYYNRSYNFYIIHFVSLADKRRYLLAISTFSLRCYIFTTSKVSSYHRIATVLSTKITSKKNDHHKIAQ
ncbi:unnamed protein product [Rhizophagus irregularis]|nr:unnamed protein product [Rhizophagus irregularis]